MCDHWCGADACGAAVNGPRHEAVRRWTIQTLWVEGHWHSSMPPKCLHPKALSGSLQTASLVARYGTEATKFCILSLHVWWCRVLEESMVVTVEPGCYFNSFLLQPAYEDSRQSPFLNKRRLEASLASPFALCKSPELRPNLPVKTSFKLACVHLYRIARL